ncbi:hypothetical protein [Aureivirga marina]|uniref:hypothetical protein n=1 Tax=Aureivirga marina TaxID=1182451 RepID=UPI0018C91E7D|nr:hypothetical protein [Aureivirga marina]
MAKLFKETEDWQFNARIPNLANRRINYVEGYVIAIEAIEKQIKENRTEIDFLIYPYLFLHRHLLELSMKEIIMLGNKILNKQEDKYKGGHDLATLWNESQKILKEVWQDQYEKPAEKTYNKLKEFHNLDLKSDGFRYPIDIDGNINLEQISSRINLNNFKEEFEDLFYCTTGLIDGLYVVLDNNF